MTEIDSRARTIPVAELTGRDIGHSVTIVDWHGVLARVLHESGSNGELLPTYIRIFTDGLTESDVRRWVPETLITVHPAEVAVIDGTVD